MKIIVDAYGGDHAPLAVLEGTAQAVEEYGITAVLAGKEQELRAVAKEHGISLSGMEFAEAETIMPVEADPTELRTTYKDSSMAVGMRLLREGKGDAFVSAGSTGAITVGATLIVGRIKGIRRPAIAVVMPTTKGAYLLADAGANTDTRPEMLFQFGVMGSLYMEHIQGISNPKVAMVNIGTEENKGRDLQIEASSLLKNAPIDFIGNIEARDLPLGGCDVAVTDGFTGNIILKLTEGMGAMLMSELKGIFMKGFSSKIAALLLKSGLGEFKARMDYTEYGGALLLGVQKPVVKAHGSSNAKAFKNAIRQANTMAQQDVIGQMEQALVNVAPPSTQE